MSSSRVGSGILGFACRTSRRPYGESARNIDGNRRCDCRLSRRIAGESAPGLSSLNTPLRVELRPRRSRRRRGSGRRTWRGRGRRRRARRARAGAPPGREEARPASCPDGGSPADRRAPPDRQQEAVEGAGVAVLARRGSAPSSGISVASANGPTDQAAERRDVAAGAEPAAEVAGERADVGALAALRLEDGVVGVGRRRSAPGDGSSPGARRVRPPRRRGRGRRRARRRS